MPEPPPSTPDADTPDADTPDADTPDADTPGDRDERGSDVLSHADCHMLLDRSAGHVGHLGYVLDGRIVILPVNYMRNGTDILLRLGTGTTLRALSDEPAVSFEIEHIDSRDSAAPEAWSVLVQGTAQLVRDPVELGEAAALGLTPLVGEPGAVYVRIAVDNVAGRRFAVGALARYQLGDPP